VGAQSGSTSAAKPETEATSAAPVAPVSEPLRFRVAVSAEAAFGRNDRFRNYLFGPRLDLRFSERTAIGYSVRYANLEGPGDRAHNALHTVMLEYRLMPSEGTGFALPLRFNGGYLPNNGPFLQPAAGLGYVGESVELLVLPVAPTFWNTGNKTWVSFDVAFEVGIRL
jgi:hypothetical protein